MMNWIAFQFIFVYDGMLAGPLSGNCTSTCPGRCSPVFLLRSLQVCCQESAVVVTRDGTGRPSNSRDDSGTQTPDRTAHSQTALV